MLKYLFATIRSTSGNQIWLPCQCLPPASRTLSGSLRSFGSLDIRFRNTVPMSKCLQPPKKPPRGRISSSASLFQPNPRGSVECGVWVKLVKLRGSLEISTLVMGQVDFHLVGNNMRHALRFNHLYSVVLGFSEVAYPSASIGMWSEEGRPQIFNIVRRSRGGHRSNDFLGSR